LRNRAWRGEIVNKTLVPQAGLLLTAGMVIAVFLYIRRADTDWLLPTPHDR
jgi:hypothetical protein